ncbi:MAG: 3-deoxy-7-phosphoheptulonate synthase [Bacteroidota bacterium]
MIIQLEKEIGADELTGIELKLNEINFKSRRVTTQDADYLVCIGKEDFDIRNIGNLKGVKDIHRVSDDYKLVSKKWRVQESQIDLGDGVSIGNGAFQMMGGPCSIEGEENIRQTVEQLAKSGVKIMRGGVYKPRSSPYSYRGIGIEGLKLWHAICQEKGIKIISEIMEEKKLEEMYPYVDIFQIGARNSQNFNLLDAMGSIDKPVMIKRGMSGTLDELLYSAEYVFSGGNEKVLLCERGIRNYEKTYRNCFDINAIPILKEKTHLPVIADPSHGIGLRRHVPQIAYASAVAGADGIIVEMHACPQKALTDAKQTISFEAFEEMVKKVELLRGVLG